MHFVEKPVPSRPNQQRRWPGIRGRESSEDVPLSLESHSTDVHRLSFSEYCVSRCATSATLLLKGDEPAARNARNPKLQFLAQVGDPEFRLILKEVLNLRVWSFPATWTERPPPLFVSPSSVM